MRSRMIHPIILYCQVYPSSAVKFLFCIWFSGHLTTHYAQSYQSTKMWDSRSSCKKSVQDCLSSNALKVIVDCDRCDGISTMLL